ncbi:hypothetical protein ACP4OV_018018 [Aristida adscensionis]
MAENADDHSSSSLDLVCAFCDNGGEIASCEGKCLRSFHATKDTGEGCPTLGYSRLQFNALKVFMCKNCEYEKYQCFACRRLGSTKTDPPEVFPCASATCGHFYHAKCAAQLLFPENEAKAIEYTVMIGNGAKFACPVHKCDVCKYGENKEVKELQFAVCRRCPKSYHRRCLPREIVFENFVENGHCIFQRAWDNLLPNNRILIYCLNHDIDPELGTPLRDHIKFPDDPAAIRKSFNHVNGLKNNLAKIKLIKDHPSVPLSGAKRSSVAMERPSLSNSMNKRRKVPVSEEKPVATKKPVVMSKLPFSSFPDIDRNTEARIYEFAQKESAAITIEDVRKKLVVPSTYTPCMQNNEKITLGKVDRSVEAVKAALYMLENGACIEEAKSVCAPSDLFQIAKWKSKLSIYLAPFLHGMRYTSYGRHFTKLDKLELIVDKLQWYIQNGDTVVDFCCGSNDFSLLLKEKLEASGKSCFYKNYDLIQPKVVYCWTHNADMAYHGNDFNFEKRDWMSVQPDELPTGCRLIMGLNPPFGFKASLANQFINKALTFKPKLIVLIVPKETERLDKKYPPYELIWEDSNQLLGKSFYLPGSLDADNKVMDQWNLSPPPLSLWSRSDWAKRHLDIAKSMRHLPSDSSCSVDPQLVMADVPSTRTTEEVDNAGVADIHATFLEQLVADTYHDATSSPGDYWTDTTGRSRQPCNYETPGRKDPTHECHQATPANSDMSISLSDRTDCQRQNQNSSISDHHSPTGAQACKAFASASDEHTAVSADCDEATSAEVLCHRREDSPAVAGHAAGVQYQLMQDTPPTKTPEAGLHLRQLKDSPPADRASGILPSRNTFPGVEFASAPLWRGGYGSRRFMSHGMGHPSVHQEPSSGWIDERD